MSTISITASIAFLLALGLVVKVVAINFLTGVFQFFFGKPQFTILKSKHASNGFAFSIKWDSAKDPVSLDTVSIRMFNPFGKPTQIEVSQKFPPKNSNFASDIDFGPDFTKMLESNNVENSVIQIQVYSSKDGFFFQFDKRGDEFLKEFHHSIGSSEEFNEKNQVKKSKVYYHTASRSFIADAKPASGPSLKIATNPEFTADFSKDDSASEGEASAVENFSVSKVWIEPGCIVCDACEAIYPEVFHVTDETCVVRPNYPMDNGLLVEEAAEACPVEVIKFSKA